MTDFILPHWAFYHRSGNGVTWTNISDNVNYKSFDATDKLNDRVTFRLEVIYGKDDTVIDIQPGDFIAVCQDSRRFDIAEGILVGIVDNPNKKISALDYVNYATEPYEISYSLDCLGWDYSEYDVFNYEHKAATLSTILDDILDDSQELLGGVINSVTVTKYSLKCPDITVSSFKTENTTALEAVDQLCKENGLYSKLIWHSQPDNTNVLKLASQVIIFDRAGLTPENFFWNEQGISDDTMKTGRVENPEYSGDTLKMQYLPTFKKPAFKEDYSNIRNYLIFNGTVADAGAFDQTLSSLERYETTAVGVNNDTYILPHPAADIYSGGFLIRGYVTDESTPTTTEFSINTELTGSVQAGDKIVLEQGTEFKIVDSVSGNTITLTTALGSPPATDDIFEVIQQDWITIYNENLEDSDYSSRGFAKELKADQPAKIRFLPDRSIPLPGTQLIFYYWPAKPYKKQIKITESITKYGMRREEINSDVIMTKEQVSEFLFAFENQTPNKTIELPECYLPIHSGEIIPVNVTDFIAENLMVTEARIKYGGIKNYSLINRYEATISTNKEDFSDLLKRLMKKQVFPASGSDNKTNKVSEKVNVLITFSLVIAASSTTEIILFSRYVTDSSLNKWQIGYMLPDGTGDTIISDGTANDIQPSISPDGATVLFSSDRATGYKMHTMDLAGGNISQVGSITEIEEGIRPTFSPDGTTILYSKLVSVDRHIFTCNADGTGETQLTSDTTGSLGQIYPWWKPDGLKIIYSSDQVVSGASDRRTFQMDANGSNQAIFYNQSSSSREIIPVYSPDGNYILFQGQKGVTHPKYEMFRITSAGASETKLTTYNEEEYFYQNFSPDSTKITYTYGYPSSEQIYTMNLDGTTKTNISNNAYREKQSFWCEAYI